ncbi:MAG: carboxylesterase/lipase family protein [Bryobacteraceae bacterium]|jgi:para-nitrobenzyl esterase
MKQPTQLGRRDLLRLGIGLASAGILRADTPIPVVTKVVKTTNGDVQGLVKDGVQVLKGIRYGAPPVGSLRFMPPVKPKPWKGAADATEFGAPAIQMAPPLSTSPATDFGRQLATIYPTPAEIKVQNEDCLFLNVWTPGLGGGTRRPVMLWIHGGGFAYGSGAWPIYDGANLAKKGDVVVVTVNHRLNVFGYLYLGQLGNDAYAKSGNAGMLDLVAALEWVRDNIEAFGGDPGNVTIMGESGGGAKVSTLLAMPAAKGLFHRAIIQSGPGLRGVPKDAATRTAKGLLDELQIGAADLKALQSLPAEDILSAAFAAAAKAGGGPMGGMMRLAPMVDGVVLPSDPFTPAAPAISANVPIMIGSNKDEMTLFTAAEPWFPTLTDTQLMERAKQIAGPKAEALVAALRKLHPDYSPTYLLNQVMTATGMFGGSITLAERKAAQKAAPAYMYYLIWETPVANGLFKSPHTLDIPLMFDNVDKARVLVGPGPEPEALARQMSDAWLAFARNGNPNAASIPEWPPYTAERRATMLFDVKSRVADDPNAEVRKILQSS